MKKIKIDKANIDSFAEVMFAFNVANQYNSQCFSASDICREREAFAITDIILEQLDKAGFDMQEVQAFKRYGWKVDDLASPVIENPVLMFECQAYERYLDSRNIVEYYADDMATGVWDIDNLIE